MKLIVGLGNPGVRYENTRHNAGFMVLDKLAEKAGVLINKEKFEGKYAKVKIKGEDVILLKPETFMNDSGFSVRACMDFFKIAPEDILVIYDDLDTPVGSIRLRQNGSAGGHNGIKSVIKCALDTDFNRIRVGIGRDPQIPIINYVLSKFKEEELEPLDEAINSAANAAWYAIDHPFQMAMSRYNVRPKKKKKEQKETAPVLTDTVSVAPVTVNAENTEQKEEEK
jgi:PTH1 family peptidyl-tRNA hydrolase